MIIGLLLMCIVWVGLTVQGVGDGGVSHAAMSMVMSATHHSATDSQLPAVSSHALSVLLLLIAASKLKANKGQKKTAALSSSEEVALHSLVTVTPSHVITRDDSSRIVNHVLNKHGIDDKVLMCKMESIIDNTRIVRRHSCRPIGWLKRHQQPQERHVDAIRACTELGTQAVIASIDKAKIEVKDIDALVCVSSCVKALPSLGRAISSALSMPLETPVIDISDVGCGAGALAIRRAAALLRDQNKTNIVLVSVETPTYLFTDATHSMQNLIKCVLFGDAAVAGVLQRSRDCTCQHGRSLILCDRDAGEITLPDTRAMAYCQPTVDGKLHFEMTKMLADGITKAGPMIADKLRSKHHDVTIAHVGGPKLVPILLNAIGKHVTGTISDTCMDGFAHTGNIVSATVLDALRRHIETPATNIDQSCLLVSVGPGFTASYVSGVVR